MHVTGIYLNIFQPSHDRHLSGIARGMRRAGLLYSAHVNTQSLTIVQTQKGATKHPIYNVEDLEPFLGGREISEFEFTDSQVSLQDV